jgi:predicted GNAT family N-acyltransferase
MRLSRNNSGSIVADLPVIMTPRTRLTIDGVEIYCGHTNAVFPELLALRNQLLRPGRPLEDCHFPGDNAESALHYGAFAADRLVAIASLLRNPLPNDATTMALQVRGMATLPEYRGRGVASELLRLCVEDACMQGAERIWCNARRHAVGLYLRQGFASVGEEFDIPGIGPHYQMCRELPAG